jgi:7-cyano-7-deazaguanine synthase in queuosine biosynthesis
VLYFNGRRIMDIIVCKLNEGDAFEADHADHILDFTKKTEYHSTFYRSLKRLYKMPKVFRKEALDLHYIAMAVYFADRRVVRSKSFDGWTRNIKLQIPVLEKKKWEKEKLLLEKMLSFLSGDNWQFEFRERTLNDLERKIQKKIQSWYLDSKFDVDAFCMLSGGLDSFIGAIDLLKENKNIAFVGLYGGGKGVKPHQDKVNEILRREFSVDEKRFFNFSATPIKGVEISTRTRSFLFFAHAIVLGSCLDKDSKLYIPENGLISLNIPLTNTRLGSSSTRTTHPYYMDLLQQLLHNLGLGINLVNPYQFFTKGEMLRNCKNEALIKLTYTDTMSCSHPDQGRYDKKKESLHCGTCLPCSIRRSAIWKAFGEDKTVYSDVDFEKPKASKEIHSFKLGLLDYQRVKTNPLVIQIAGPINENFDMYHQVYQRGMDELAEFLGTIHV